MRIVDNSPSHYVARTEQEVLPLEEAVVLLQEAEEQKGRRGMDLWLALLGNGGDVDDRLWWW